MRIGFNAKRISIIAIIIMTLLTLVTQYKGTTDVIEYSSVAKFFAGLYDAKVRSSHSVTYSIIHAPLVSLFKSVDIMKVTSLIFLILLIISMYYISKKNKKVLLLASLSPIFWYMAPWINPIQLSSLLFLWSYFFLKKFQDLGTTKHLFYSGILLGLSWLFWNTVIFMAIFFLLVFFFNKKTKHLILYLIFILIGLFPLLVLDQILYGFPFYSILRHFIANVVASLFGGIYSVSQSKIDILWSYITFLLMIPFYAYTLFTKGFFARNRKEVTFISLSLLFLLVNPQIRYLLFISPLILILLAESLNEVQYRRQIILFIIISLVVVTPYIIQIKYSTNNAEFDSFVSSLGNLKTSSTNPNEVMNQDLEAISTEYPNQVFVVGNHPDIYATLALNYWGGDIQELVSIQDYNLWLNNQTSLFQKTFMPIPRIADRRQIWIAGGMTKNTHDSTDYSAITYAIGVNEPINLGNFSVIKKYNVLYLSKKSS